MSEKYIIDGSTLTNIADAIRTKTGETSGIDPADFPAKVDEVFSAGEKSEYDRFWDSYQQNGNRTDYNLAFAGIGWNADTFKPKYIVRPTGENAYQMFARTGVEVLDETVLDFSKVEIAQMSLYLSNYLKSVTIDISSLKRFTDLFNNARALTTLVLKNIPETCNFTGGFTSCTNLTDFTVTGTIGGTNLDLHWSTLLSADSGESIINALSTTSTGGTLTLPLAWSERYLAKYDAGKYSELLASRGNWTIAYL